MHFPFHNCRCFHTVRLEKESGPVHARRSFVGISDQLSSHMHDIAIQPTSQFVYSQILTQTLMISLLPRKNHQKTLFLLSVSESKPYQVEVLLHFHM